MVADRDCFLPGVPRVMCIGITMQICNNTCTLMIQNIDDVGMGDACFDFCTNME